MKRDRLYEIVLALILGNLGWMCVKLINALLIIPTSTYFWFLLAGNVVAIIGLFWLFRDYKNRLRRARKEQEFLLKDRQGYVSNYLKKDK